MKDNGNKEKTNNKVSIFKKISSSNKANKKAIENEDFININIEKDDKNHGKISLLERLSFILKEDDLDDYIWILDEENESVKETKKNKKIKKKHNKENEKELKEISGEKSFMKDRIINTIALGFGLLCVMILFFIANLFYFHIKIPLGVYFIIFVIGTFITFKIGYLRIKKQFNKKRSEVYNSFPLWVSTLQILIISNNVTNTFKKSLPTCPKAFKRDLEKFVEEIEFDPDNKEHYKNFLKRYKIDEINEIIMDMYAFNRMDKNEIVRQFKIVNERLNKIQNNIRTRKQEQSLFFISALNSIPLLTASIYVLIVSMMLSSV